MDIRIFCLVTSTHSTFSQIFFLFISADPCEPQNIPGPNFALAPSAAPGASTSSSSPINLNAPNTSGGGASNPVVPSTSTSPPGTSSSSPNSANSSHQSPYDLRKKSPTISHDSWATAGPSSSTPHQFQCIPSISNNSTNSEMGCFLLPARKRPRRIYSTSTDSTVTSAAHYLQYEMPDEVLLTIFSYLLEQDLCRLSLVCKRFNTIANDTELWKRLYQSVYEYDIPLFNPEVCKFHFVKPEDSDFANPWKESFRQLYRGIHVRPGYQERKYKGRSISYFNTVQAALDYADERTGTSTTLTPNSVNSLNCSSSSSNSSSMAIDDNNVPDNTGSLIFLHAGHYRGEFLVIDSDVALIGAAPGNVAESIVLERESESTVMFVEGAKHAYVGHMTLKFSPDVTSTVPHHKHYCLEVGENCSPTIDHCIIRSTSVGESSTFICIPFWEC